MTTTPKTIRITRAAAELLAELTVTGKRGARCDLSANVVDFAVYCELRDLGLVALHHSAIAGPRIFATDAGHRAVAAI